MTGRRLRRLLGGLVFFPVALAGCSGEEPEQPAPVPTVKRMSVDQACAGLFPGDGGKALERVLESTEFLLRNEKWSPDVRAVAQVMENAYRSGDRIRNMPQSTCEVSGVEKERHTPSAIVRFTASSKWDDSSAGSDRGVWVSTRERKVVDLAYDCVSPRVGSTPEAPLRVGLLFQDRWQGSKGEDVLRPDYLTVTHSAALAVARELQCVDDGGLPARAGDLPPPD
ncbi:hypothetical protein ABZ766_32985 [Streptomyces sp. NPDC006670]|uniref:hypothetical protein n=1 Tax=Streptomyces sp. NPDC006670 TaxID=3154476 RepID=UPI0034018066